MDGCGTVSTLTREPCRLLAGHVIMSRQRNKFHDPQPRVHGAVGLWIAGLWVRIVDEANGSGSRARAARLLGKVILIDDEHALQLVDFDRLLQDRHPGEARVDSLRAVAGHEHEPQAARPPDPR